VKSEWQRRTIKKERRDRSWVGGSPWRTWRASAAWNEEAEERRVRSTQACECEVKVKVKVKVKGKVKGKVKVIVLYS
jgi:hypothetical protein